MVVSGTAEISGVMGRESRIDRGEAVYSEANLAARDRILRASLLRRIAWGAVFAGVLVALSAQLALTTLGAGIGLSLAEPTTAGEPVRTMAFGAGLWWLITGLIALALGGWVAGRTAGFLGSADAGLHGLLVWCVTAVLGVIFVATTAAGLVGGAVTPVARMMPRGDWSWSINQGGSTPSFRDTSGTYAVPGTPGASGVSSEVYAPSAQQGSQGAGLSGGPSVTELSSGSGTTGRTDASDRAQIPTPTAEDARRAARALSGAALWSFMALVLGAITTSSMAMVGRPKGLPEQAL